MRLQHSAPRPRDGFTLLELLVVIGIIVALMAILLPAVMAILAKMEDVKQVAEIKTLQDRINLFKEKHGRCPPSQIVLIENSAYDMTKPAHSYSVEYLRAIFPGILLSTVAGQAYENDWDGDGKAVAGVEYYLEGDQCLVYFLAGPQQKGFYHKKADPVPPDGKYKDKDTNRDAPYFEFDQTRLVVPADPLTLPTRQASSAAFRVYKDRYGTPFAYFLARDVGVNNYPNDCPSLCGAGFDPYFSKLEQKGIQQIKTYHNSGSFQIISAGRIIASLPTQAQQFGTGGLFDRANGGAMTQADQNNYANFTGGQMRYGQ